MKTKQNKQKSNSRVNILFWHNVFLDTLKFKTSEKDPFSTEKLSVCKNFFLDNCIKKDDVSNINIYSSRL